MAYSVSITGFSKNNEEKIFSLDALWWDGFRLLSDSRFKSFEVNPGYLDSSASLSIDEMKELQDKYRPEKDSHQVELWGDEIKFIDDALNVYGDKVYSRFTVWISEL